MEAKEKAKELVDKFTLVGLQQRNEGIQCALIAVDEIAKELSVLPYGRQYLSRMDYYREVKDEIEKL